MNKTTAKKVLVSMLAAAMVVALAACSDSGSNTKTAAASGYKDGTYSGRSSDFEADESGNGAGYGEVSIELKDNKVTACEFKMYELDGTLKDETYGSDLSKENRLKAQKAVQAAGKYASMLVDAGDINGVDVISGATISYSEFVEAVNDALSKAAE